MLDNDNVMKILSLHSFYFLYSACRLIVSPIIDIILAVVRVPQLVIVKLLLHQLCVFL